MGNGGERDRAGNINSMPALQGGVKSSNSMSVPVRTPSGDTTPCRMTGVTLYSHVSSARAEPFRQTPARRCDAAAFPLKVDRVVKVDAAVASCPR